MQTKIENSFLRFAGLSKADLHIHSNYSDGKASIEEILAYVENKTDLSIIAITDHDTLDGALKAKRIAENHKFKFEIIVGEEITSKDGHIVGLFLKERVNPGMSARRTVNAIHRQDGLAIAVHPFYNTHFFHPDHPIMHGVGPSILLRLRSIFDAVESVNSTLTLGQSNILAQIYNKTVIHSAETGSSDAHILDAIGHGYTLFQGKSKSDLRRSILRAQTKAMYKRWHFLEILRYMYFFIPKGLRIVTYSILHPRHLKNK